MNLRQLRERTPLTEPERRARAEGRVDDPLTQEELAARTSGKLSQTAISHLEKARTRDPKYSTLLALADAMQVSVDDVHAAYQETLRQEAA